ncbi:hypothetical protein RvY_13110 [Ramazzottius varieornatus]|uniref:Uncharacterized protein n=1 Tax=Ramazzottius varieornatus TaxID=947166 RepID=A0A1D1VLT1_RAMVA|nr:hypothetical protein RvY_13110 [Ramazzottius varieornatus]
MWEIAVADVTVWIEFSHSRKAARAAVIAVHNQLLKVLPANFCSLWSHQCQPDLLIHTPGQDGCSYLRSDAQHGRRTPVLHIRAAFWLHEHHPQTSKQLRSCPLVIPASRSTKLHQCPVPTGFPIPSNQCSPHGYRLRSKVYWCRSSYCWSSRIRRWYRQCVRKFDYRIRTEPFAKTTAFLLCHLGIRLVRSHGSFLSDDGFPLAVRFLDIPSVYKHIHPLYHPR